MEKIIINVFQKKSQSIVAIEALLIPNTRDILCFSYQLKAFMYWNVQKKWTPKYAINYFTYMTIIYCCDFMPTIYPHNKNCPLIWSVLSSKHSPNTEWYVMFSSYTPCQILTNIFRILFSPASSYYAKNRKRTWSSFRTCLFFLGRWVILSCLDDPKIEHID